MHVATRHATSVPGVDAISILSDRSFPRHSHDEFGFGYVVRGGQESWSGRGSVEARAGDTITVNPSELHDGIGHSGRPRQWNMLFISPSVISEYAGKSPSTAEFEQPVIPANPHRVLVELAFAAVTAPSIDHNHVEKRVTLALRDVLSSGNHDRLGSDASCSRAVSEIVTRIHEEWSEPLSLSDFANISGLSKYQTLRHFLKEVGATPHAYLTQLRVKQSKRLICTGMPLAEAAIAAGFSDQSHMTRAFRRQFGVTPGRFAG